MLDFEKANFHSAVFFRHMEADKFSFRWATFHGYTLFDYMFDLVNNIPDDDPIFFGSWARLDVFDPLLEGVHERASEWPGYWSPKERDPGDDREGRWGKLAWKDLDPEDDFNA